MGETRAEALRGRTFELLQLMVDIPLVQPELGRQRTSEGALLEVIREPAPLLEIEALHLLLKRWVMARELVEAVHQDTMASRSTPWHGEPAMGPGPTHSVVPV